MRFVVLLRGVNVGGHRRVPMAELRTLLTGLGFADVQTYLQSGNVVLTAENEPEQLERRVHDAILDGMGVDTTVLVRTAGELADVVARNPWPDRVDEPKKLHAVFLTAEAPAAQDFSRYAPEEVHVDGRTAYVWYALGAGRTKLPAQVPGVEGTARNWTTVLALMEMTRD